MDQIPPLLGAVAVVVTGVTKFAGKASRLRSRIRHDQEMFEKLPEGETRALLCVHIEEAIRTLVQIEADRAQRSSDWFGIILSLAFASMTVGMAGWTLDAQWPLALEVTAWAGVVVLALFAVVGLTESIHKKPNDDDGVNSDAQPQDGASST